MDIMRTHLLVIIGGLLPDMKDKRLGGDLDLDYRFVIS
jgi:hypothetical protein